MTPFILYCSISWLIGVGIGMNKNEDFGFDIATILALLTAPLTVPMYIGYRISKIK